MSEPEALIETALKEILRDAHGYVPGVEQNRPVDFPGVNDGAGRLLLRARERGRDLLERAAGRAGFSHRHFEPELASERLSRMFELSAGLDRTYRRLGDESSRRALIDLMKLRVLGPHHARLAITPQGYRAKQAHVEEAFRLTAGTFEVSDPWFSPLSLYRVPVGEDFVITLHDHSVDIVSVFLLEQYAYPGRVHVNAGDVVLDVGGCWGDTALYFANQVGPSGKVYTFEFDPESLGILRVNLALNPELASRIEIVELALWDRSGLTLGFIPAGRCTTVVDDPSVEHVSRVSTITLDEFVKQAGLDRVAFVKVDAEGAERNVLRGGLDSLAAFRPRLAVAAYHRDDDLIALPSTIESIHHDYQLYLRTFSPVEEETVLFACEAPVGPP